MKLEDIRNISVCLSLSLLSLFESYLAVLSLCKGQIELEMGDYYLVMVCFLVCTAAAFVGFYFGKKKDGVAFGAFCYIVIGSLVAFLCTVYMALRYLG